MAIDRRSPTPGTYRTSSARAFARVGWPSIWAKLYLYATCTLRLAALEAETAGLVEAADLVSELCVKSLDGTLGWTLGDDATEAQIVGLACAKLAGMRWTLQRQAGRTVDDDAIDERPDPGPDVLRRLVAKRELADLAKPFAGDAEALTYLRGMLDEETRPEIASRLGWTVERAKIVRLRIMRGVTARARRAKDDGDPA